MRAAVRFAILAMALGIAGQALWAQGRTARGRDSREPGKQAAPLWAADTFAGLQLRGLGPALMSGRIGDIAIHPADRRVWYVAVASGGVWKTANAGTTWSPIFDAQGSYSIGCVTIDPSNPLTLWVGTGENNSQRSVGYGDGVYKSADGGRTWENVGLKQSEHIGRIVVDPRDSDVVYAAAQGPLWSPGGDRGLYKTSDGGRTWSRILEAGPDTGVNEVWLDPRDADILYATTYQRRRHVWTLINGGPFSGIHKSYDGGVTWKKLENGLPKEDKGRIGLAISPANPDVVYAIVEAANKSGGFFRSVDAGGNWEKMSDYMSSSPQYYNEIVADPKSVGRVYSLDTWMMVTEDGGKTFRKVGEKYKHVDNHALIIDPEQTDHLLAGCDGGVYESFDRGATWFYFTNLPITQFYKVAVDDALPFYNVYGGTQDNSTIGGPSRTRTAHGIVNSDWFLTVMGDGFQTQVDPRNPDIVYSQAQHGALVRFDRRNGEMIDIQPQPEADGEALRWNWDSPLIISPHLHTRLYFAANKLFRSDDRGDSWREVSGDLTRQVDRNKLKVMGRVWSVDAVAKNASTSFYGNIVALDESPLMEGLIYVGTDDGLIQVTEDGGSTWRAIDRFPGVPDMSYVSRLTASRHDIGVVYAAFDNHKMGDFKPYVLRSDDRGRTWSSAAGDLPERGSVYALAEDHESPSLLFAGTEFGVFFTPDRGSRWIQLKGGMPTIIVKDLAIQRRESDLVVGTFGRGFFILDDYSPLRLATSELLESEATLFPVKQAPMFIPSVPLGLREKSMQGDSLYTAPNPPFGAVFTVYLKEEYKTRRKVRQEAEAAAIEKGEEISYPGWDRLKAEDREEEPALVLTISDEDGATVRRITAPAKAGFQRVAWDFRLPPSVPVSLSAPPSDNPFVDPAAGPMMPPGAYTARLSKRIDGVETPLSEPRPFTAAPLGEASLPAKDRKALADFQRKTARLQRAVLGAVEAAREAQSRIAHVKKAIDETPAADPRLGAEARALEARLKDLLIDLTGDSTRASRNEPTPPSILDRVQQVVAGHWSSLSDATGTHRRGYDLAAARFDRTLASLRSLIGTELERLEDEAETAGAPWTPGRLPSWRPE
ncbi:MAG TPA: glycosyl hydrolase [Candidatus Polarisedimenticolia bacterium]|nr:glycosyl hydrolase [Candidatus Polarisedimenticolia bacterium]